MNTILYPLLGTLFTFLMTTLGSALVFFFKDEIKDFYQQLCLSFAAGAMMYVVVEELIPEAQLGKHSHVGTFGVLSGFVIMMLMDVFLG